MNEWESPITDWSDTDHKLSFVERGKNSDNKAEYNNKLMLRNAEKYNILNKMNICIPGKNEAVFYITTKPLSLIDVTDYIEKKCGNIEEAIIYLFTINDIAAHYITELNKRADIKLIISDIINSKREKERLITKILENGNVDIVFCHSHAKIIAIKISENYFVMTGSMNSGNNAKIENLQINNSYEFYKFIEKSYYELKKTHSIGKRYE